MRDAAQIERQAEDTVVTPSKTPRPVHQRGRPAHQRGLCAPWKPGQSGNLNGRPKNDAAKEIAQAIFENNKQLIYESYVKALRKGSGFTYQVLADRGFGPVPQTVDVNVNVTLAERVEKLRERKKREK